MKKQASSSVHGSWRLAAARFRRNRLAMAGVVLLGLMALAILLAPLYMSYSDMIHQDVFNKLRSPCAEHPLGTDELGRDLLARILYGGRISLFGGIATIAIAFVAGCVIGGAAGYFGGRIDTLLMRFIDMLMAIPPVLLAMAILTALGSGLANLIISLAVSQVPRFARVVRSAVLTLRGLDYIEAARSFGCGSAKVILRHILPNGIGPIVVSATLTLGQIILSISSMGFLGLGVAHAGVGHHHLGEHAEHPLLSLSGPCAWHLHLPGGHGRELHRRRAEGRLRPARRTLRWRAWKLPEKSCLR